ncbi:MAG: nucleotide exchange factor GrpE [Planctomycetes bacterium]|nr:nucleotide exchange factor GrpE [Planctomycetota bacterium]
MNEKDREQPEESRAEQRADQPSAESGGAGAANAENQQASDGQAPERETQKLAELSLQEQLEAAIAERDANYDRWMRARAELDNFRKRSRKEADEMRKYQALSLIRDLLPALDNLERAIQAAEQNQATSPQETLKQLTEGLKMVHRQFLDIIARYGAKPIEAMHQPFDPSLHEAVSQMPSSDHPPMTVLQEVERGYTLHDRVVRPAKVIVSRVPENGETGQQNATPGGEATDGSAQAATSS